MLDFDLKSLAVRFDVAFATATLGNADIHAQRSISSFGLNPDLGCGEACRQRSLRPASKTAHMRHSSHRPNAAVATRTADVVDSAAF